MNKQKDNKMKEFLKRTKKERIVSIIFIAIVCSFFASGVFWAYQQIGLFNLSFNLIFANFIGSLFAIFLFTILINYYNQKFKRENEPTQNKQT